MQYTTVQTGGFCSRAARPQHRVMTADHTLKRPTRVLPILTVRKLEKCYVSVETRKTVLFWTPGLTTLVAV